MPVTKLPASSLAFWPSEGEPVPQADILGALGVEEAVMCPYWSTSKSLIAPAPRLGDVVATTVKIEPVVEAVLSWNIGVLNPSATTTALAEVVAIESVANGLVVPIPTFCESFIVSAVVSTPLELAVRKLKIPEILSPLAVEPTVATIEDETSKPVLPYPSNVFAPIVSPTTTVEGVA